MLREDEETGRFRPVTDTRPDDVIWPALSWPPPSGLRLSGTAVELTAFDPTLDAAGLFAALDHEIVWRHVNGRPRDPDHFAAIIARRQAQGMFVWLVRLSRPLAGLDAGTIVGTTTFLDVSVADANLEIGSTTYTPAVWASAVNPDTKYQLLRHAFDEIGAGRVQLKTDVRNVRSQQAIARLGARYEGTLRRHKRRADGTMRDSVLFSIVAEEWPSVRERLLARLGADARNQPDR